MPQPRITRRYRADTVADIRQVPCPNCQAPSGERCTQPTDTGRRDVAWVHLARSSSAIESETEQ